MPARTIRFALVFLFLSACVLATPKAGWAIGRSLPVVPNVTGDYVGLFFGQDGSVRDISLTGLATDRFNRVSGQFGFAGLTFPIYGPLTSDGHCSIVGSVGSGRNSTLTQDRMLWENLGDGAGALVGDGNLVSRALRTREHPEGLNGPVVLYRSYANQGRTAAASFNVLGAYSGTLHSAVSGDGTVAAQITDGTSNTIRLALALTSGHVTANYVCVGDVAPNGAFSAVGAGHDGTLAIIRGYMEQDLRGGVHFSGDVQIKNLQGRLLDTASIIAVLIG